MGVPVEGDEPQTEPGSARTGGDRWWLIVAGLAAVGLVVRVAYTLALGQHVDLGITDATFYNGAANALADGRGYIDPWRAFITGDPAPTAHHPPGWPALLSVASLLGGRSELAHRLVGCGVGALVVVVAALLGRRLAGRRAGIASGAIVALHPTFVAADGSLMSETLGGLLALAVLVVVLRGWDDPRGRWFVLAGATAGLAALVRGEGLAYLPLVVVPLAAAAAWRAARRSGDGASAARAPRRAALSMAALGVAGCVAVVGPWTARNAVQLGGFVPISINESTVLAGANCEPSYHGPNLGGWSLGCVVIESEGGEELTELEEAAEWRAQGLRYARDNVRRLPVVVPVRVLRTWGVWAPFPSTAEGRHTGLQNVGTAVWLGALAPLAAAGAVVLARRRRWIELAVAVSPAVVATAVSVVGFGMLRFRHSIELSAALLTGVALVAALDRLRARGGTDPDGGAELHAHA